MLLKIDLYGIKIHCFHSTAMDKVVKTLKRRKTRFKKPLNVTAGDTSELKAFDNVAGFVYQLEKQPGHFVLYINEDKDNDQFLPTVAHEVMHLAIQIFTHIGASVNSETEEPFCYLYDHILEKVLKWLKEEKNDISRNTYKSKKLDTKLSEVSKPDNGTQGEERTTSIGGAGEAPLL